MFDVQRLKARTFAKLLTFEGKQLLILKDFIHGDPVLRLQYTGEMGRTSLTTSFETEFGRDETFDMLTQEWLEAELGK